MTAAQEIVAKYHAATDRGDWKAARGFLEDDLAFQGPLDTFHKADDYLAALQRLHPMIERVDIQRTFAEGSDVVVLCDLHFRPPMPTMYVVEWYQVRGDRIARVKVVFDPRPMSPPGA